MKKRIKLLLVLSVFLILTACGQDEIHERTEFMMDTVISLKIYDGKNDQAMDQAVARLEEIEATMSAHLDDSDLVKINKMAGKEAVEVDSELYKIIEKSIEIAELSDGAYEPSIGPLVDLWNVKEGEKDRKSLPSQEDIDRARELVDYRKISLLGNNRVKLEEEGMKLDLGGIVKGYAADEVRDIFKENGVGSAIIDLGGNIYVMGIKPDKEMWNIGIQDPFDEANGYLGILKMDNQTIVTSGDYERYFEFDGKKYHHIIDSKTGYPSASDLSGVSIISNNSKEADALSTAVFVLGREKGQELLEKFDDTDAIYVSKDKKLYIDKIFEDKFELTDEKFTLMD